MDLIAYALRSEFTGTVEQDGEQVPIFTGGVIRAGDLDIDVREELEAGNGLIVVDTRAAGAVVHLDEYPPLKRVKVPEGAAPTGTFEDAGPYRLRTRDEMAGDLATRGIAGTGRAKLEDLVDAANEHDERLAAGTLDELGAPLTVEKLAGVRRGELEPDAVTVSATAGTFGPSPDQPATGDQGGTPAPVDVEGLSTDELVAVLEDDREAFAGAGDVEVPAAVTELRARAAGNDGVAVAALEAHGLADSAVDDGTTDDQAGAAGEEG